MAQQTLDMVQAAVIPPPQPPLAAPAIVEDLRNQIADFLAYATDAAVDPLLSADIPFVGDALKSLVTEVLLAPVKEAIDDALAGIDSAVAAIPGAIADAINAIEGDLVTAVVEGANVRIMLAANDTVDAASDPFSIDIGLEGLGFSLDGAVSGALGYDIDAELLFNTDTGDLTLVDKAGDLITLSLEGSLDGIDASGQLGFLTIDVTDQLDAPEITLTGTVDITGDKLVGDLTIDSLETRINGGANVNFGLAASLDGAAPSDPSPLPRLFADLVASYNIVDFDPESGLSGLGATPSIALNDMELDVGTLVQWLGEVMQPITERIFGAFALEELLDAITAPIPVIDEGSKAIGLFDLINIIEDSNINLLDLAAAGFPDSKPVIEAFAKAYNLIKGIAALVDEGGLGGGSRINFGDYVLLGDAPTLKGAAALTAADYLAQLADVLDDFDAPDSEGMPTGSGPLSGLLQDTGFSIPLLEDPSAIVGLFLNGLGGEPIDLVRYDVPKLEFNAGFSQFFPIVGPIGVGLYGQFGAGIDIEIGYDTAGLANGNLAEGFFITTKELNNPRLVGGLGGSTVYYESAGFVDAEIGASAGINVGIAEVSVGGGVFAGLDAYFEGATVEGDGKLRLSDLSLCMFDPIVGEMGVKVNVTFRVGIGPFSYTKRFDIVKVTLATFEFGCTPETDPNHGLANLNSALGVLTLNAGDRAEERVINGKAGEDIDETYVLSRGAGGAIKVAAFTLLETNGHPNGDETGDDNVAINIITGHMGDENDQVAVEADVTAAVQLGGDDGNDLLQGGKAADTLNGGEDDDRLIGQGGGDTLEGEDGNDVLEGGLGADTIDGGDDFDQVTYENSTVGVTFRVSASDDEVFVGTGGDAQGDRVTNVEHVIGSHFNDRLYGNPDDSNTLEGLAGSDTLVGGDDDDLLLGGGGADNLQGRDGDDTISFLTSSGQVVVNLSTGNGAMGDAEGDQYSSIENVHGTAYDDTITGNGSDNVIDGWAGDDTLSSGGGEDELRGGSGDDLIYASGDEDVLDGGGSLNAPGRDTLSFAKAGAGVDIDLIDDDDLFPRAIQYPTVGLPVAMTNYSTFEDIVGSAFGDTLRADYQNNRIEGGNGADTLDGSEGNDTIVGGLGGDAIIGGGGARDHADYSGSTGAVTVNLAAGIGSGGHAQGDTLSGIEDLTGSRYADTLVGNAGNNRLDPGLTNSATTDDGVDGAGGIDTLALNYGERDIGQGMFAGFTGVGTGQFYRRNAAGTDFIDRGVFTNIEKLDVIGTYKNDIVYGGESDDFVQTDNGTDLVFTGRGFDRVDAGAGNDIVYVGTDTNRQLATIRTSSFGDIRGGAGIDYYGLSLADAAYNITLTGLNGAGEFWGTNFTNGTGSAISEFEVLLTAITGFGDDKITQAGTFLGNYTGGFGVDIFTPGQGVDLIDGGQDFRRDKEVVIGNPDNGRTPLIVQGDDMAAVYANDGDLLRIDYRTAAQGIASTMAQVDTNHYLVHERTKANVAVLSNTGAYNAGNTHAVSFSNIERVELRGTTFGDEIFGTNLTYGLNSYVRQRPGDRPDASLSLRGDDMLYGYQGNDRIVGGTGDDKIDAGDGDDVIYGSEHIPGRVQPQADLGELDALTGGKGRDVFVLGNYLYSFYDDQYKGAANWTNASTANRAIISDFDRNEDKIVLSSLGLTAPAGGYVAVERDNTTFIYLRDGRDAAGNPVEKNNELVAELRGVTGFELRADYVVYSTVQGSGWIYGDGSVAPVPFPAGYVAPNPSAMTGPSPEAAPAALNEAAQAAAVAEAAAATVEAAAANDWITQTSDIGKLDLALWGGKDDPFYDGILTIEGYGASFGTFKDDPFGLGEGVVLSTGRVADIAGKNLIDGGRQPQQETELVFEDLGQADPTAVSGPGTAHIYRAKLSNLGFDINSLKLGDSGSGFGGASGAGSGFDIDAVVMSRTKVDAFTSVAQFNALNRIDAFSFTVADTEYHPGDIRAPSNETDLRNTVNGLPNFAAASLNTLDSTGTAVGARHLSLGDGGSLGLDLKQTVSTEQPLYLYIAEAGATGETITTGFTASAGRLDAAADLNTDLGRPGDDDDTAALVYRFNGRGADKTSTQVAFDFVFFSEEFAEFAQSEFNDKFKITLNGVNMTQLNSGAFGSVSTIFAPPAGPDAQSSIYSFYTKPLQSDYVGNPVDGGPYADVVKADGFSKVLRFVGNINPGVENVIRIEVSDTADGLLDSGLFISGKLLTDTVARFEIDRPVDPVREGQEQFADYGIVLPTGVALDGDVKVTFRPDAFVDLGAGAGVAITETLTPAELNGELRYVVVDDRQAYTDRTDLIAIEIVGLDGVEDVAPMAIDVIDRVPTNRYVLGDSAERASPDTWQLDWSRDGVDIDHTANYRSTRVVWSDVSFSSRNGDVLRGGDIYRGDLGVSGNKGDLARVPQEITGTEGLRFVFKSAAVDAIDIDFALFEEGDAARLQFYDAGGKLMLTRVARDDSFDVSGLGGVQTMVISSAAGGFMLDQVEVTELRSPAQAFVTNEPEPEMLRPADRLHFFHVEASQMGFYF